MAVAGVVRRPLISSGVQYTWYLWNNQLQKYNNDINIAIRIIDKNLKKRGILISNSTREEIKKHKEIVVSHKIAIAITNDKIYIAPVTIQKMNKKFKEKCRINKVPKNIRAYIFKLEEEQLFIF